MIDFMIKRGFLAIALLISSVTYAGINVRSDVKSGTAIAIGAVVEKEGNRYTTSSVTSIGNRNYYTERAFGLVKLSAAQLYIGNYSGTATVVLDIECKTEINGVYTTKTVTQVLKLEADNAKVIDAAYYKAEGAEYVKATVTAVNIPSGWPLLELEASVSTESFEYMSLSDISAISLSHSSTLTYDGNLRINWTALSAAENYELEWTYVSNQGATSGTTLAPIDIEIDRFLFKNNSSRVVVSGLSYDIPMMYEKGYILYRLRAVGKRIANGVVVESQTNWTANDGVYSNVASFPAANKFLFDGHEQNLNWQSSLSFAEEGKHKAVLAYHDGSMRNRQAVTRINTDERAIVGETLYDFNGRPVIQVLPVPDTSNNLTYFPHYNLIEGENILKKENYSLITSGEGCAVNSPLFSTATGASSYYSPQNQFDTLGNTGKNMLNRNLIPDAKKYPYTQTQYTPDNTGRIVSQSGVGDAHQIGTGHETKYFYGSPQQEELTRLFGNQVGYNVHYKKNMTVDPNGQVSVSYMNMGGKVVATALAGNTPGNVDSLLGDKTKIISTNLFGMDGSTNTLSTDGLTKTYSSKLTVPANNKYKFDYTAVLGYYDLTCINSTNPFHLPLDGAVDLKIQLVDGCGSVVFVEQQNTASGNTGNSQNLAMTKSGVELKQGEYQLVKTLGINEEKLEKYWEDYLLMNNTCILKEQNFLQEEIAKLDLTGCDLSCEKCQDEIDKILNDPDAIYSIEERARISSICDDLCDKGIGCRGSMEAMRGDMSPGGQYAELRKSKVTSSGAPDAKFDENNEAVVGEVSVTLNNKDGDFDAGNDEDNKINVSLFPLSLFNESNSLPVSDYVKSASPTATWRKPIKIEVPGYTGINWGNQVLNVKEISLQNATYSVTDYMDRATGLPFEATVVYNPLDNTFKPEITLSLGNAEVHEEDAENNLYKVKVKYLKNIADFEKFWQPHWSSYLLPYHPEYGYLVDCFSNADSNDFDYALVGAETVQEAINAGYLSASGIPLIIGSTQALSKDVFIKSNPSNYNYMKNRNGNYKGSQTMAQMATSNANCPRSIETTVCGVSTCGDGLINTDIEWNIYKALYLAEKQQLQKVQATKKAVDKHYYNGCIGAKDFYTLPDAAYFRLPQAQSYTYSYQDCHFSWFDFWDGFWDCHTETRTATAFIPPVLNPNQVCFIDRADRFKDKSKRFFLTAPSNAGGGQVPTHCSSFNYDTLGIAYKVPVPCDNDITEAMNEVILEAQRFKYESCGLCPLASDVEVLLMNLRENGYMPSSQNVHLTCPNDTVQLGDVIYRQLLSLNGNNSDISWTSSLSADRKTLNGVFKTAGTTTATVSLTIPSTVPVTFATLSKMCCLSTSSANNGKSFTFKSSYYNPILKKDTTFYIDGEFSLRLDTCYIPPKCMVTDDSRRVMLFLNMLASTGENKVSELNTTGADVTLSGSQIKRNYYATAVRTLLKKDNDLEYGGYVYDISIYQPKWKATASGGDLEGFFTYMDGSELAIEIDISGLSGYSYADIKEFSRVRPVPGEPTKFYVDAVISSNGPTDVYQVLTVETPSLRPTVCKEAVAPLK